MRQILVDHVRTKNVEKHGGGKPNSSVDEATEVAIHRLSDLIEMHFLGGLTAEESAEARG